jgi:hypothetical protein
MTTFGEALHRANEEWQREYGRSLADLENGALTHKQINDAASVAFLKSLEASGFKIIGPELTREMWAAAGDAIVKLPNVGIHHDKITEAVHPALHAAAPSVTDLLAKE